MRPRRALVPRPPGSGPPIRWRRVLLTLLLMGPATGRAQEFRYLGFGDSSTAGSFDETGQGGYPPGLAGLLG